MKKKFIYLMLLFATTWVACKKEKALNVDITKSNLDTFVPGEIDKYLKENFLDPYNIAVLYRFDRYFPQLDKEVTPVREDKIKLVMEGVKATFIEPYMSIGGKAFFKPKVPKQLGLFGSAEYSDQQITLGNADAGRQINLFVLNNFSNTDPTTFLQLFHTMHHEFGHILNQNIPASPDYEAISNSYIGSSWVGASNPANVAKGLGYITRYARSNKDEDFVEMVATMLAEGRDFFDAYTNTAEATASAKLRKKEQMVIDYYKTSFGLDFRALQVSVRAAIDAYGPASIRTLPFNFSAGSYKGFTLDKTAAGQPAGFVTAYNSAAENLLDNYGIIFQGLDLDFANLITNRTDMILKVKAKAEDDSFDGYLFYNIKATLNTTTGRITFALAAPGTSVEYGNGTGLQPMMKPLLDYLTTKTLTISWIDNVIPNSKDVLVGFIDQSNSQLSFYGTIKR